MSGTSDTEYSSEGGSVEGVGSYYQYDVSITYCYVICSFKRELAQLLFHFIEVPLLLNF